MLVLLAMITQAELKRQVTYCPETGIFTWNIDRPPRAKKGATAGWANGNGYRRMAFHGVKYFAHRLAFLWMTGAMPKEVDHVNQCRDDNRWDNLRGSNRHSNALNVKGKFNVRQRYGRWYARLGEKHLGAFATEQEALAARKAAVIAAVGSDPELTCEAY